MKKAKRIGESEIFDIPGVKFWLYYCPYCECLMNVPKNCRDIFKCTTCAEKLELEW